MFRVKRFKKYKQLLVLSLLLILLSALALNASEDLKHRISVLEINKAYAGEFSGLPGARAVLVRGDGDDLEGPSKTGELFLGGNYIELGISSWGDFGTLGNKPANFRGTANAKITDADLLGTGLTASMFRPSGGSTRIGMSADFDGFGVGYDIPIDYYLPGTPEERFAVGYKIGSTYARSNSAQMRTMDMTTTVENLSDISAGILKAKVVSTWADKMEITQVYSFHENDKFYRTDVTLKNLTTEEVWDSARYMRSFDPDNTQFRGGSFVTDNVVTHTYDDDGRAVVKAEVTGTNDPLFRLTGSRMPFFFYSTDPRARATAFGFSNPNPYVAQAYDSPPEKGRVITADMGIAITWDSGPLAAGATSSTFTFFSSLDERDFSVVEREINLTIAAGAIVESLLNDGSIDESQKQSIRVEGATLRSVLDRANFRFNNLPAGLGFDFERISDTEVEFTFTGNATKHTSEYSTENISVTIGAGNLVGATRSYTSDTFEMMFRDPAMLYVEEAVVNERTEPSDGVIEEKQKVRIYNGKFAESITSSGITVNNLPAGLTTSAIRIDDTTIEITFGGAASPHTNNEDVLNASISVAAENILSEAPPEGLTSNTFKINFNEKEPVIQVMPSFITERAANDGRFDDPIVLKLHGEYAFAETLNTGMFTGVNLPTGLSIGGVTRESDKEAKITLGGTATSHNRVDSTTNSAINVLATAIDSYGDAVESSLFSVIFISPPPSVTVTPNKITDNGITGEITTPAAIMVKDGTFVLDVEDIRAGITANNLPPGISIEITRISNTELSVEFKGRATEAIPASKYVSFNISADVIDGSDASITTNTIWLDTPSDSIALDKDRAALTWNTIKNRNVVQTNVGSSLNLVTTGLYGSSISWTSDNTRFVNNTGVVIRPNAAQGNQTVRLTATIRKGEETRTKSFVIIVTVPEESDVQKDREDLTEDVIRKTNPDIKNVETDLDLPTTGVRGSTISWEAVPTGWIGTSSANRGQVLQRPSYSQGDIEVLLTAKLRNADGSIELLKQFLIVILAETKNNEEKVKEDGDVIRPTVKGDNPDDNTITEDLDLPNTGPKNGSNITWDAFPAGWVNTTPPESDADPKVGAILQRPSFEEGDVSVLLIGTITLSGASDEIIIPIKIKAYEKTRAELDGDISSDRDNLTEEDIKGENEDLENVNKDLDLPSEGDAGSAITWTAYPEGWVNTTPPAIEGDLALGEILKRPTFEEGDVKVTLTATISKPGTLPKYKNFLVTIKKLDKVVERPKTSAEEEVDKDWEDLGGGDPDDPEDPNRPPAPDVVALPSPGKISPMPVTGTSGSAITWTAYPTGWVNTTPPVIEGAKEIGAILKRPTYTQGDVIVTLIATITSGEGEAEVTRTKSFTVTIPALPKPDKTSEELDVDRDVENLDEPEFDPGAGDNGEISPLPDTGDSGTTITWTAYPEGWVNTTTTPGAIIKRPTYDIGDITVTLTATVMKDGVPAKERQFLVVITALPEPAEELKVKLTSTPRYVMEDEGFSQTLRLVLANAKFKGDGSISLEEGDINLGDLVLWRDFSNLTISAITVSTSGPAISILDITLEGDLTKTDGRASILLDANVFEDYDRPLRADFIVETEAEKSVRLDRDVLGSGDPEADPVDENRPPTDEGCDEGVCGEEPGTIGVIAPLPTTGTSGSAITWSASPAGWVNTTPPAIEGDLAIGAILKRPTHAQGDVIVLLTATITKTIGEDGEVTAVDYKHFSVVIEALPAPEVAEEPEAKIAVANDYNALTVAPTYDPAEGDFGVITNLLEVGTVSGSAITWTASPMGWIDVEEVDEQYLLDIEDNKASVLKIPSYKDGDIRVKLTATVSKTIGEGEDTSTEVRTKHFYVTIPATDAPEDPLLSIGEAPQIVPTPLVVVESPTFNQTFQLNSFNDTFKTGITGAAIELRGDFTGLTVNSVTEVFGSEILVNISGNLVIADAETTTGSGIIAILPEWLNVSSADLETVIEVQKRIDADVEEDRDALGETLPVPMPETGARGTTITWDAFPSGYIDVPSGEVIEENRPTFYEGDIEILVTATISKEGAEDRIKQYIAVVTASPRPIEDVNKEIVESDLEELGDPNLDYNDGDKGVIKPMVAAGTSGSAITWTAIPAGWVNTIPPTIPTIISGEPEIGTILKRPTHLEGDIEVVLIATITKGDEIRHKYFNINIEALPEPTKFPEEEDVLKDWEDLGAPDINALPAPGRVGPLPTSGTSGSAITWSASPAGWVNTTLPAPDSDDPEIGAILQRPTHEQGDIILTLTATITKDGAEPRNKQFFVTIPALPAPTEAERVRLTVDPLYVTEDEDFEQIITLTVVNAEFKDPENEEDRLLISMFDLRKDFANLTISAITLAPESVNVLNVTLTGDLSQTSGSGIILVSNDAFTTNVGTLRTEITVETAEEEIVRKDWEDLGGNDDWVLPLPEDESPPSDGKPKLDYEDSGDGEGDPGSGTAEGVIKPLETEGAGGSTITWSAFPTGWVSTDTETLGHILKRPKHDEGSIDVILTGTITSGSAIRTKQFKVTILPLDPPVLTPDPEEPGDGEPGEPGEPVGPEVPAEFIGRVGVAADITRLTENAALEQVVELKIYNDLFARNVTNSAIRLQGDFAGFEVKNAILNTTRSALTITLEGALTKTSGSGIIVLPADILYRHNRDLSVTIVVETADDVTVREDAEVLGEVDWDLEGEDPPPDNGKPKVDYDDDAGTGDDPKKGVIKPLPTTGTSGSAIAWSASPTGWVNTTTSPGAIIKRPTYEQGDIDVVLTATITSGSAISTKLFYITIDALEAAVAADNPDQDDVDEERERVKSDLGDDEDGDREVGNDEETIGPLTTEGDDGTTITWSAFPAGWVNTTPPVGDGDPEIGAIIQRPTYAQGEVKVLLTGRITKNDAESFVQRTIIIKALPVDDGSALEKANADAANIKEDVIKKDNENLDNVTGDLDLSRESEHGSTITWAANPTGYVSLLEGSFGNIIKRPNYAQGDVVVMLTATIKNGTAEVIKRIPIRIKAELTHPREFAYADADVLRIGYQSGDNSNNVTRAVILSATGENGSTITWTSSRPSLISNIGSVNRPLSDTVVKLVARISKDGFHRDKEFSVVVKGTSIVDLAADKASLEVIFADGDDYDSVTSNVFLTKRGVTGSRIEWSSSDNTFVNPETGKVTRPGPTELDKTITLTATMFDTMDNTETKEFTLIIKKMTEQEAADDAARSLTTSQAPGTDPETRAFTFSTGDTWESITTGFATLMEGKHDTVIIWSTDKPAVVNITGYTATINRVANDETVRLTATVRTPGGKESQKTFLLIVKGNTISNTSVRTGQLRTAPAVVDQDGVVELEPLTIYRTTLNTGKKIDLVYASEPEIDRLLGLINPRDEDESRRTIDISITGNDADELAVEIPANAVASMADRNTVFNISTDNGKIVIPDSSLKTLKERGIDLYFRFVKETNADEILRINREIERYNAGAGVKLEPISAGGFDPLKVETNYDSVTTKFVLPLALLDIPSATAAERTEYLNTLRVYVEHTDGTKALYNGTIEYNLSGDPIGFAIQIQKFSKFKLVQATGDIPQQQPQQDDGDVWQPPGTVYKPDEKDPTILIVQPPGKPSGQPFELELDEPTVSEMFAKDDQKTDIVVVIPNDTSGKPLDSSKIIVPHGISKDLDSRDGKLEIKQGGLEVILTGRQQLDIKSNYAPLGSDLEDSKLSIYIEKTKSEELSAQKEELAKSGVTLVGDTYKIAIDTLVGDASYPSTYLQGYAKIRIPVPEGMEYITTAVIIEDTGKVSHVPTDIKKIGDTWYAEVNSYRAGTFGIVFTPQHFDDMFNHWGFEIVNNMASRLIATGEERNVYAPEKETTRGEFIRTMVRALGLEDSTKDSIDIAKEFEFVLGYADGSIKEEQLITREEAIVILSRGMKFTDLVNDKNSASDHTVAKTIDTFVDKESIARWSEEAIVQALENGIINGYTDGTIRPHAKLTKAQMSVVYSNLLRNSSLINK